MNKTSWDRAFVIVCAGFLLGSGGALGASATWNSAPMNGDWNNGANWSAGGPPNGATDIATFALSNTIALSLSANTQVNGTTFSPGASMFAITAPPMRTLTISGIGLTNNSGSTQNFVTTLDASGAHGTINFTNNATAGSATAFTTKGQLLSGRDDGAIQFFGSSSADHSTFVNNGALVVGLFGGRTRFFDGSTAGDATFSNNATAGGTSAGGMFFFGSSTAGNAVFTNHGGATSGSSGGFVEFFITSSAGSGRFTNNGGAGTDGGSGVTYFLDSSTAGNGTLTNNGGAVGADGGFTEMLQTSTGGNGTFISNGGAAKGEGGGTTIFNDSATAGDGMFIANGGVNGGANGDTLFYGISDAGNSALVAYGSADGGAGGLIAILDDSTGNTARVEVFGNGNLEISPHSAPGVMVGSIEGNGDVFLGANTLTVGSNNLSTTFSGVIQDGGVAGGAGGSLTKIGSASLTLSGPNTYTGETAVNAGRLLANDSTGSGSGSGAVVVSNSGTVLGGTGMIGGPVTVNTGAILLGGDAVAVNGSLKIGGDLILNSGAIIGLLLGAPGAHSSLTRTDGIWAFAPNQEFTFLDLGAQPGFYDNIITGLTSDPGDAASWTITNAGFTGTFAYDGLGNIDLNLTAANGPVLQLTSAVSRKMHGGLGPFDILLPFSGEPGVECRNTNGNHTLVFAFSNDVVSGNASLTTGTGVAGGSSFAGHTMTVNLTGVADLQKITVTLSNVRDTLSQILPDKAVKVNMLIGDTNGSRTVNAADIAQTKSQSGAPVTAANFRTDINASGTVSASDIGQVKANAGHTLPPEP